MYAVAVGDCACGWQHGATHVGSTRSMHTVSGQEETWGMNGRGVGGRGGLFREPHSVVGVGNTSGDGGLH